MSPIRVLVYGSCVSRDTFEFLPQDAFTLVSYIARQSTISAFSPSRTTLDLSLISSRFQRRMLEGDAIGSLPSTLHEMRDRADMVLWDLVDERLGVLAAPEGGHVTRTVEAISAQLPERLPAWRLIEFGSDEHFGLWRSSVDRFAALLSELRLADRSLLLEMPWAESFEDGSPAPSSFGLAPATANDRYTRYYAHVRELGLPVVSWRRDEVHASADHKWGAAPFHYTDATYHRVATAISHRCRPDGSAPAPA